MLRWDLAKWLIASAAAAATFLGVPQVAGEPIATTIATPAPTPLPPRIGKLLIDIETGESSARRASAEELARSNDSRSIGALIAAMKDEDAEVRRAAMLGLWRVGRPAFDRLITS